MQGQNISAQHQPRIEDLFAHGQEDHRLSYFYHSNQIISSPDPLRHFLTNFTGYTPTQQQTILKALIKALRAVSTNAYLLNESQSQQHSMQCIRTLIQLLPQHLNNYLIFSLLTQVLQLLLPFSTLDSSLIRSLTNKIVLQFYDEQHKVSPQMLFCCIIAIKTLYSCKLEAEKQPKNTMVFHGDKGLEMLPIENQTPLSWKLQQGMTLMMWVYVEDVKFGAENKLPKLFTMYAAGKGGIEAYLIDNKIFYRVLGSRYSEPQIGSNGIMLGELEVRKWNFVCFEQEGNKVFMKSKLNFYINRNKPSSFSVDPPKIGKTTPTKYVFFDSFYGKSSSVGIFTNPIGTQSIEEYSRNVNSLQNLKKTKALVFQLRQGKLYERGGMAYCPTYVLERDLSMDFKQLAPLFYLIRHQGQTPHYPILNQLLDVVILFCRQSARNQHQFSTQEYFKLISTQLCLLSSQHCQQLLDENTVKEVLHIKHTITDSGLLDQYLGDFLWGMMLSQTKNVRKQEMMEILKNSFVQNLGHYQFVVGFDEMLNYLVKLQPKTVSCCQKHHNLVTSKLLSSFSFDEHGDNERLTIKYILQLIQIHFQNPQINFAPECYKLCRLLTLKFSPCFILDLIHLLKKIITQKFNEKISESQIKKILKYFEDKKIYLIFLHVIENSFFAEIKAEAVKMIYKVLRIKKYSSEKNQIEISLTISKALWKINEDKNLQVPSPSEEQVSLQDINQKANTNKREEQIYQEEENGHQQQSRLALKRPKKGLLPQDLLVEETEQNGNKEFKEVGPVAPLLRNKDKGNKTFDFGFVNSKIISHDIQKLSEQLAQPVIEKPKKRKKITIETHLDEDTKQQPLSEQLSKHQEEENNQPAMTGKKKGKKSFGLSINTDQINEMYTFGGQKGQQILVSKEQQKAELQKIKKLTYICVNSMRKGRGQQLLELSNQTKSKSKQNNVTPVMPPSTTKNKTLQERKKKLLNLNFINEEEEEADSDGQKNCTKLQLLQKISEKNSYQQPKEQKEQEFSLQILPKKNPKKPKPTMLQKVPSPKPSPTQLHYSAKKYSNVSPSSNKSSSSSQNNLLSLYNSLLECCLGVDFQTSLIEHSKIQIPSVLCIFFKWIPETDLETKFLNDLDIITEQQENIQVVLNIPQLYDFMFELCYKCILLEQMGEKRIYTEKLELFLKKMFQYVFRQDPAGGSKLNFIVEWVEEKKDEYHPKSLLLTTRYATALIIDSFEEYLIMNKNNDKIMQKNFQSLGSLLECLTKLVPVESPEQFQLDFNQKVCFIEEVQVVPSLSPYFKSKWVDESLVQKYLYLFKKYFSTKWYNKGPSILLINDEKKNLITSQSLGQMDKEAIYYLRQNFLVSIVELTRAVYLNQKQNPAMSEQEVGKIAEEIVWGLVALVILSETAKDKATVKSHKTQRILCFLKTCKVLAENSTPQITKIIPILSSIKHSLAIIRMQQKQTSGTMTSSLGKQGILDEMISNYIPEQLLHMDKSNQIESFRLYFADVWVPSENHYKKVHSELFLKYKEKHRKIQQKTVSFIEMISNMIEEENQRFYYLQLLLEVDRRRNLNKVRKLWENSRVYSHLWKVPGLKGQIDSLFSRNYFAYEKYEPNPYFKYKVSKHQSKAKARYFLKMRLQEPRYVLKELYGERITQKNDIHLHKAIIYGSSQLSIGKSKINWLNQGEKIQAVPHYSLDIILPFKKIHLINTLTIRSGHFAIINDKLFFTPDYLKQRPNHLAIKEYQLRRDKSLIKFWPLEYVKDVLRRRYVNRKKAVQITFIHGKSILLEFAYVNDLEDFFKKISKLKANKCPNLAYVGKTTDGKKAFDNYGFLAKWNNYEISNFQYLMQLNNVAGRSYADITQYPVLPWILIDFKSTKLSLTNEENYRVLQLPMGALGSEERTLNFQERYHMLTMDDKEQRKFHYGTHYSSPGIVYHFLIRLSPFTEGAVLLQSGKFDFADRLFFSMADSYKNATTEHSDVRQLLPELYTIPQAYLNINKLDMGVMQSKKRVHNVQLPQWARGNPFLYVTKLRKAFEQNYVSEHINNWIDLIFGYKQKGQEATKNLNRFYYLTYEDTVDWDNIQDQKETNAIESQIINFGQTPSQIFIKPHSERNNIFFIKQFNSVSDPESEPKVYRPSKNSSLLQEEAQLNPFKQVDSSIVHMKWVKEDMFIFVRRNGDILFYKLHPPLSGQNSKVPFQCAIKNQKKVDRVLKADPDNGLMFDHSLEVNEFPIDAINKGNVLCIAGLMDGKLALVDIETNQLLEVYHCHETTISCIKADSKDNFLITGDTKGNVVIWRIISAQNSTKLSVYQTFNDQKGQISSIFFSYELKCFAVSSREGSVFLYNIISGKKLKSYHHPNSQPFDMVVVSTNPLACIVIFSNVQGLIYCYSINGQLIQRVHEKDSQCLVAATLLKNSIGFEYLAYGNERGEVLVRAMPYIDNPIKLTVAKEAVVNRVCSSKNGKYLVTGCSDGQLSIVTDPNPVNR